MQPMHLWERGRPEGGPGHPSPEKAHPMAVGVPCQKPQPMDLSLQAEWVLPGWGAGQRGLTHLKWGHPLLALGEGLPVWGLQPLGWGQPVQAQGGWWVHPFAAWAGLVGA